ncbi:MAG: hypothetical protein FWD68_04940 [Alphaproteobacteria bacterium]|nr:hypothetical protein [Alphaproteobacteria bacterium]
MVITIGNHPVLSISRDVNPNETDAPRIAFVDHRPMMYFGNRTISATASVKLNGEAGENAEKWIAGFIQVQVAETNWSSYRGRYDSHGSIFCQRGGAARAVRICRDSRHPNSVFFPEDMINVQHLASTATGSPAGAPFPQMLRPTHFDQPGQGVKLIEYNSITHKLNYLHKANLELRFCTVLSVRDPDGNYYHLSHFYWGMSWKAKCSTTVSDRNGSGYHLNMIIERRPDDGAPNDAKVDFDVIPYGSASNSVSIGAVITGEPTDPELKRVLTAQSHPTCNDTARNAANAQIMRPSLRWTAFDVPR